MVVEDAKSAQHSHLSSQRSWVAATNKDPPEAAVAEEDTHPIAKIDAKKNAMLRNTNLNPNSRLGMRL